MHGCSLLNRAGSRPLLLATLSLLAACAPRAGLSPLPGGPQEAAQAYLDAWARGDLATQARLLVAPPADFAAQQERWRQGLGIGASRFEVRDLEGGARAGEARVRVRAVHSVRGLGDWEVESTLPFEQQADGSWRLRWSPAVLHPEARAGDRFQRTREWGPRGALLDARGEPLTVEGDVVRIGVDPRRVQDPAQVAAALQEQLGVEPARVQGALGVRTADGFVPLIDVRPERYAQVRPALAPVPGIFFRRARARLAPAEGFAVHTLGRVGEVTAEALAALGAPYQAGDRVGLSGLERAQERRLAGAPSGELALVRPSGERVRLQRFEGRGGEAVRTTLRREVQGAAEAALEGVAQPAALVAVDAGSGAVLAIASRPLGAPLHRALTGRYPPGSTFKVVTAEALLAVGMQPGAPAQCPAEAVAGGKRFRNFEAEVLGDVTLREAFAHSCNTAFVLLGARLDPRALEDAAARFGFGVAYDAGLPSPGATFPPPQDDAERAAAAIGQGRVLATPLHMASVAAAVQAGRWRAPHLLEDPDVDVPDAKLSSGTASALRTLMRAVVTEGTGRAAAGVPGLIGKTGTAEFGHAVPPETHAWFIGVHEGVGFAVLVEGGGVGGKVAVPIAARFVEALRATR
ncbi:penicillin-binding transpeptidase domain-containing protein [Aggregicoccus sp. 17bor-14]|uniref:penicillin-binding transpeptidase domain-containing protein n=1 Tax=Myxococcaceae TaxID=31 RepID=UPI00351A3DD7